MADATTTLIDITIIVEHYPPRDPFHGTADAMTRRLIALRFPEGSARFEQTDYGHPGRYNAWAPRGIDPPLQARADELAALCESLAPFAT